MPAQLLYQTLTLVRALGQEAIATAKQAQEKSAELQQLLDAQKGMSQSDNDGTLAELKARVDGLEQELDSAKASLVQAQESENILKVQAKKAVEKLKAKSEEQRSRLEVRCVCCNK